MEEHKIGSMDITEQEKTFDGFIKVTKFVLLFVFVILMIMALFNS